jgi:hypothetical protein
VENANFHCHGKYGCSSKKLKLDLPCDLAVPLLGTYPEKMKSAYQQAVCMPTVTVTLFTIAKMCHWRVDGYDACMFVHIYTYMYIMECYAALKKDGILSFGTTWIELDGVMLSEMSQTQKTRISCFLSYVEAKKNVNLKVE